jgi:hypothetical protein
MTAMSIRPTKTMVSQPSKGTESTSVAYSGPPPIAAHDNALSNFCDETGVTMTNQTYDAIIIGTSEEGRPFSKRLPEAGVGTDYDEAQRVESSIA